MSDFIKKKKKIDLDAIVSKAMNKEEKTPYITKKEKLFITKKSPEQIREREMVKKASGGRAGFKHGSKGCKLAMKGKGRAYGKNS
jgi:hypothetical protein